MMSMCNVWKYLIAGEGSNQSQTLISAIQWQERGNGHCKKIPRKHKKKGFMLLRVFKHCNRLPRVTQQCLFLEILKIQLSVLF